MSHFSSQFSIRSLVRSDINQLREILATRDDTVGEELDRRLEVMTWLAFDNPVADAETTYFVAEADGKLIGYLGRMPANFAMDGRVVKGYFVHDLFVTPAHRGMGLFISIALYKAAKAESDSFCFGLWATLLNMKIQRSLGFFREEAVANYVKILKAETALYNVIKSPRLRRVLGWLPNTVLLGFDVLRRGVARSAPVEAVERFDERFDELNARLASRLGICTAKTAEFLNWKFVDRPSNTHRVYAVSEGDSVLGFVVLDLARHEDHGQAVGLILDLTADPSDKKTVSALIEKAVSHFRELGVGTIQCVLSESRIVSVLKGHLFLHRETWKQAVMLSNLDKCPLPEAFVRDMSNWHLTGGESDGSIFL